MRLDLMGVDHRSIDNMLVESDSKSKDNTKIAITPENAKKLGQWVSKFAMDFDKAMDEKDLRQARLCAREMRGTVNQVEEIIDSLCADAGLPSLD